MSTARRMLVGLAIGMLLGACGCGAPHPLAPPAGAQQVEPTPQPPFPVDASENPDAAPGPPAETVSAR